MNLHVCMCVCIYVYLICTITRPLGPTVCLSVVAVFLHLNSSSPRADRQLLGSYFLVIHRRVDRLVGRLVSTKLGLTTGQTGGQADTLSDL
ncbi:hypothetical protein BKA80DRAFT_271893 [Phyllosticta citrichinensis]